MNSVIIVKAKAFAIKAHGEQKYGDFPYHKHLQDVAENLVKLYPEASTPPYLQAAAWLHDTMEDTDATFNSIFYDFGKYIARTVFAVTNEPGQNRKERNARTYPKIMAAGRDAIAVKLADRISNVEHSLKYNHGMFKMYEKEYRDFRKALFLPGELKNMWSRLDVLMDMKVENKE